jgi:4,5-dihydroxyphthalate decarboxylase
VDLARVTWVLSGDEHVAEYRAPANVVAVEKGQKLADMLVAGELAAAIGIEVDHPDVQPLIPGGDEAGLAALRLRGHYPVNHLVVMRDELLQAEPELAAQAFEAFAASKRIYLERLMTGRIDKPTAIDELHRRVAALIGDPLPYGIEPNHAVLEEAIGHCLSQGILARRPKLDELFAPATRALVA